MSVTEAGVAVGVPCWCVDEEAGISGALTWSEVVMRQCGTVGSGGQDQMLWPHYLGFSLDPNLPVLWFTHLSKQEMTRTMSSTQATLCDPWLLLLLLLFVGAEGESQAGASRPAWVP